MQDRSWAILVALSALLTILSAPWALDQPALVYVFKPLTTLLVIAYAWRRGADRATVRRWVLVGLWFSLGGDVALMWPKEGFLPGLVSFLLAHLAYLVAFTREQRLAETPAPFVVFALVAGAILAALWPSVPQPLRVPVLAYVVCLASMGAQAAVVWRWVGRCSSPPTRCWRRTSSRCRCRRRRCGCSPPTGRRSGASRAGSRRQLTCGAT